MPNLVPLLTPVSKYWANLKRRCLRVPDCGQLLIKENCHNSRTSDDVEIKLRPATKPDKRNKTTSKQFDDYIKLGNCDEIVIFFNLRPICSNHIPDALSVKLMVLLIVTFYLTRKENGTKKSLTQFSQ